MSSGASSLPKIVKNGLRCVFVLRVLCMSRKYLNISLMFSELEKDATKFYLCAFSCPLQVHFCCIPASENPTEKAEENGLETVHMGTCAGANKHFWSKRGENQAGGRKERLNLFNP